MIKRLLLCPLFFVFTTSLWAQGPTASPLVMPRKQFLDQAGNPLAYGHVCTYTVGTSTPQVTYTDYTGVIPNAICDPIPVPPIGGIILDAGGYASIYVKCTDSPYKIVVYDLNGVLQWSEDGVQYPDCTGGVTPHNLLSATHPDTSAYTPPEVGDVIRGSASQLWERLPRGVLGEVLTMINDGGTLLPDWAAAGAAICTDLSAVTDIYAATTGDDTTGDGTAGNPYRTIGRSFEDIPGIVCGRYIVHLMDAGEYLGQNNLSGRIFAGGGQDLTTGDIDWPWGVSGVNEADNTWAYSWVEVLGDTSIATTFIVKIAAGVGISSGQAVFSISNANLTLRGISVENGGFGVGASNKSYVNLAGVQFKNNIIGVTAGHGSRVHLDRSGTVNDDFQTLVAFVNDKAATLFDGGFDIHDASWIDDSNWRNTGAASAYILSYDDTGGTLGSSYGIRFMSNSGGHIYSQFVCAVEVATSCVKAYNSNPIMETVDATGVTNPAVSAIILQDSSLTSEAGGNYSLTNWAIGVSLDQQSKLGTLPSFTGVTQSWRFLHQNDTFVSPPISGSIVTKKDTIAFSATPTFDMQQGGFKFMTLTNNVTSSSITNADDGQEVTFLICQDGVGGHTFAWPANVLGTVAIGATLSKCSTQRFVYESVAGTWYAVPGNDM